MSLPQTVISAIPRIVVHDRDGAKRTGTGFIIAPGRVLTALHVIDGDHAQSTRDKLVAADAKIRLYFRNNLDEPGLDVEATVDWTCFSERNAKEDWVVLRCEDPRLLSARPLQPGMLRSYFELVRWVGFGYLPHTGGLALDGDFLPTMVQGSAARWQVRCNQTATTGGSSLGGLSGGPCFVAGRVVGMFVEELATASAGSVGNRLNTAYVLPLSVICAGHPELWPDWQPQGPPHLPGLLPLRAVLKKESFRAYLSSEYLPYYSRKEHLTVAPPPAGIVVEDEAALLQRLLAEDVRGLLVSGGGGYGKTRLLIELGKMAAERGHVVARVEHQLPLSSLDRLVEALPPGKVALLLLDYVETQVNFDQIVGKLEELSAWGHDVRYLVSCRTSYLPIVQATVRDFHHVDLSPLDDNGGPSTRLSAWLSGLRDAATGHILRCAGLSDDEALREAYGRNPAVAAFSLWLHEQGRGNELSFLVREQEFVRYVARRVGTSFIKEDKLPGSEFFGNLAILLSLLPLPTQDVGFSTWQERILNVLAADGWIEIEETEVPSFVAAHDVLVDRILLSAVEARAVTLPSYVRGLLAEAARLDAIGSALTALQRVAYAQPNQKPATIDWYVLLTESLRAHPQVWREARLDLLRTPLLSTLEHVRLLVDERMAFASCVADPRFHRRLGRILINISDGDVAVQPEQRIHLGAWLRTAARFVSDDNYLLTKGLTISPEAVKSAALDWLARHPLEVQTHYLLRQWLVSKLPAAEVQSFVQEWLDRLCRHHKWSFLMTAWLEAGGSLDSVRPSLLIWLRHHGPRVDASFVLTAWMKHGGELESIREGVQNFVKLHSRLLTAGFVYGHWLRAGGEVALIRDGMRAWLAENSERLDADTLFVEWLQKGCNPVEVQEALRRWLTRHGQIYAAGLLLDAWLKGGGSCAVIQEGFVAWLQLHGLHKAANFVIEQWLRAGGSLDVVQEPMLAWMKKNSYLGGSIFTLGAWLSAGGSIELVQEPLLNWAARHASAESAELLSTMLAQDDSELARQRVLEWTNAHRKRTAFLNWLDDGNNPHLVRDEVRSWLQLQGSAAAALIVYRIWFAAGGDLDTVREPLLSWFAAHGGTPIAVALLVRWLEGGGAIVDIQEHVLHWLQDSKGRAGKRLVSALSNAPDLSAPMLQAILDWGHFNPRQSAIQRLLSLCGHLNRPDLAMILFSHSVAALEVLLAMLPLPSYRPPQIESLLQQLLAAKTLEAPEVRSMLLELSRRWVRHPDSFTCPPEDLGMVHPRLVIGRVEALFAAGLLSLPDDEPHLLRLVDLLASYSEDVRRKLGAELRKLKQHIPRQDSLRTKLLSILPT